MSDAARYLYAIATGKATPDQLTVPVSRLEELGEKLVEDLRIKLGVPTATNGPSIPGDWPHLVTGDLQDSVAYKVVNGGIELGYTQHIHKSWFGNDFNYGDFLQYEKGRKGPSNIFEENAAELDKVFGVGNYTIKEHPYETINL